MIMEDFNDLFDEEVVEQTTENIITNENDENSIDSFFEEDEKLDKTDSSILDEFLKLKGIQEGKITIIDEDNTEQEVDFSSLSREEQLDILNSSDNEISNDLEDTEIELLNHLRTNNLSVKDFLDNYKQSIIEEINKEQVPNYEIDAYDDQELFLLDLQQKYDLTEEELAQQLEKELQDENIFKKKVDILRKEYKELEDQYKQNQQKEFEEKQEQEYNEFSEKMVNVAIETPEFYGIELDDDEKNEVLSFLLDLDNNGNSNFYKSLNDPKKLYEAAWFLRYGKESFDALKNAYESEINKYKTQDDKKKPIVYNSVNDKSKNKSNSIYDLNF